MPQSLSNLLVHIVFSTKSRAPVLTPETRGDLYPYMGGILRSLGCKPIQIGGVEDHVHLLVDLSRTLTVAQVLKETKTGTSKWLKTKSPALANFAWQTGYGAFSVSRGNRDQVVAYILAQEEHHRTVSFQDEYRVLLREMGIEFDERYLWD